MDLKNRKVAMFRTHIEPGIGPMPKNAFNAADPKMKMDAHLTPIGVHVKLHTGEEHVVPYANIQSMKLIPEPSTEKTPTRQ